MSEKIPTTEPSLEKPENKKVVLEAVAELEKPIKKIIEKIKPRIENGEYTLIIGDDSSGRIPTRILGDFIKKVNEQKGFKKPNVVFVPGRLEAEGVPWLKAFGRKSTKENEQIQEAQKYLSSWGAVKDKKILIITDTLKTGESLKTLISLIEETGYNCDIVTIGIEPVMLGQGIKENLRGIDVFSGEYHDKNLDDNSNTPLVYKEESRKFAGVYKRPGDKVSKTLKSSVLPEGISSGDVNPESINVDNSRQEIQDSINQAREDSNVVVDHLIDWYNFQIKNEK